MDQAIWNNVMWLFLTGSGEITTPELDDLAAACSEAYADNFLPLLSNLTTLEGTQVVLYSAGDAFEGVAGAGGSGSAGSTNNLPANITACVSWNIAPHYRGGHPRTYIPGLRIANVLDNTSWDPTFVSSLTSAGNSFHADLEAISGISSGISTVEHGVASFVRSGDWRDPPVFYRITSCTVDTRIDTQRRRLGRDR
jgi:hypothetical protein